MKIKLALIAAALGLASAQAMACYTVYGANNRVVYNAIEPPVDMRLPLHQTLPKVFPGGHMVFDTSNDCPRENEVVAEAVTTPAGAGLRRQPAVSTSPLLTDQSVAQAMNLPHARVAQGVAVVPAQAVARLDLPTFSVISSDTAMASAGGFPTQYMGAGPAQRPATQAMGAGPAPQRMPTATQSMGAGPAMPGLGAQAQPARGNIITELRDPPVTIIQSGRDVIVRQR